MKHSAREDKGKSGQVGTVQSKFTHKWWQIMDKETKKHRICIKQEISTKPPNECKQIYWVAV